MKNYPALQFESFEWHYDLAIANKNYRIIESFGINTSKKNIEIEKGVFEDIPKLQELIKKIPKDKLPVCDTVMKYNLKLFNNISFASIFPYNI